VYRYRGGVGRRAKSREGARGERAKAEISTHKPSMRAARIRHMGAHIDMWAPMIIYIYIYIYILYICIYIYTYIYMLSSLYNSSVIRAIVMHSAHAHSTLHRVNLR